MPERGWATSPKPAADVERQTAGDVLPGHESGEEAFKARSMEVHRSAEVRGEEGNTVLVRVSFDQQKLRETSSPIRRSAPAPRPRSTAASGRSATVWFHDLVDFIRAKILFRLVRDQRNMTKTCCSRALLVIAIALPTFDRWSCKLFRGAERPIRSSTRVRQVQAKTIKLPAKEPGVLVQLDRQRRRSRVKGPGHRPRSTTASRRCRRRRPSTRLRRRLQAWKDDVEIRYAKAQAAVAKATTKSWSRPINWPQGRAGRRDSTRPSWNGTAPCWRSKNPATTKSWPSIEAYTKQAELDAAELAIKRRNDHRAVRWQSSKIQRKQDEWVNPGDPILDSLRLDTMHVEGAVEQSRIRSARNSRLRRDGRSRAGPRPQGNRPRPDHQRQLDRALDGSLQRPRRSRQPPGTRQLDPAATAMPAKMTIHLGTGGAAHRSQPTTVKG